MSSLFKVGLWLIIFLFFGCQVPIPREFKLEDFHNFDIYTLSVDPEGYEQTIDPEFNSFTELTLHFRDEDLLDLMDENFQSEYSLSRFIKGETSPLIILVEDHLLFSIGYGGGYDREGFSPYVQYALIWDGEYIQTPSGILVRLAFSFKDLDLRRAGVWKYLGYDISALKTEKTKELIIDFHGYQHPIVYRY